GAPHPDPSAYARKFSGKYEHRDINGGIGHNLAQECPEACAIAVIDVDHSYLRVNSMNARCRISEVQLSISTARSGNLFYVCRRRPVWSLGCSQTARCIVGQ